MRFWSPKAAHGFRHLCGLRTAAEPHRELLLKKPLKQSPNSGTASASASDLDAYCKLLDACIRSNSLEQARTIHQQILDCGSLSSDPRLLEKLAQMYINSGRVEVAREVFDKMSHRSVFLWNGMIRAYAWSGPFERALELYERMVTSGVQPNKFTFPFVLKACSGLAALEDGIKFHEHAKRMGLDGDLYVSTALIDMYMKCGRLEDAEDVFWRMPKRDVVSWNAMVAGCALHGMYKETIEFTLEMQNASISPNPSTMVALLPVIGQVKALRQGKSIHGYCARRHFSEKDVLVNTALLDMYAKCEALPFARMIFNGMNCRNEVTWSAMIGGFVLCNRMVEALRLFRQMISECSSSAAPNSCASILRACASLGDLDTGCEHR